jgi:hypothetical protein
MPEATATTAAEKQVVNEATTGTAPQEFSYTFKDGRTIKDTTQEGLTNQIAKRYDDELYPHFETLKAENAQFRQSVSQLVNGKQTESGFSQEKYLDLWTKSPVEAQQYLNSHDPTITTAVNQLEQIQWQQQTQAFREANPDFAMSRENINLLSNVCDQMYPGLKVINAMQMEAAHLHCQKHKLYGETTVTQPTQKVATPPPPQTSGSSHENAPDYTKMDQNQLREYITSLEQQQR